MMKSMVKSILYLAFVIYVMTVDAYGETIMQKQLAPCPDKPNCVFSGSKDPEHAIDPYRYSGDADTARHLLVRIIQKQARTEIINQEESYIHVTFTSMILRFTDDVEFLFDDSKKIIHVRSASRVGRSDFGINRKRVELLRGLLNAELERSDKK